MVLQNQYYVKSSYVCIRMSILHISTSEKKKLQLILQNHCYNILLCVVRKTIFKNMLSALELSLCLPGYLKIGWYRLFAASK